MPKVTEYTDRKLFVAAFTALGFVEESFADAENGPMESDDFDTDIVDSEGRPVGMWYQIAISSWQGVLAPNADTFEDYIDDQRGEPYMPDECPTQEQGPETFGEEPSEEVFAAALRDEDEFCQEGA